LPLYLLFVRKSSGRDYQSRSFANIGKATLMLLATAADNCGDGSGGGGVTRTHDTRIVIPLPCIDIANLFAAKWGVSVLDQQARPISFGLAPSLISSNAWKCLWLWKSWRGSISGPPGRIP
jgi:hypothetical protein